MTRNVSILLNKTKKHISALGYLYYMVPDAGSLILLKEGGDNNHYLMIVFTGRNRIWEYDRRYLSIGTLYADNFKQVQQGINQYLSNGKL
jgi:hypothetical protein